MEALADQHAWEQEQRAKGGARANYAIAQSKAGGVKTAITLQDLEQSWQPDETSHVQEDMFSCFCSY
jgi:hypothetical protein